MERVRTLIRESIKHYTTSEKEGARMGIPQPNPLGTFFEEYLALLRHNPNNIGTTTRMTVAPHSARDYERRLIAWMGRLYHDKGADGYLCSGSTEGNIMGLWIGREKLLGKTSPIVIAHSESHTSIRKACDLLGLQLILTKKNEWFAPLDGKTVTAMLPKEDRPIIIVATAGHTMTGIIDDVPSITAALRRSKRKFYVHVDAAINGCTLPFVGKGKLFDFSNKDVSSLTTDFHKYGYGPYPSGLFLCRKRLQSHIQREAEYGGVKDDTLIGSRPGAIAVLMYANIVYLGRQGYKELLEKTMKKKAYFLQALEKKNIAYIHAADSPSLCIILKRRLPATIEQRFRMHATKKNYGDKEMFAYQFFFYHDSPKGKLDQVLRSL